MVERHDYTPYGAVLGSGSTVGYPYLFAGRRKDEGTDLYYMRARYYHSEMGRFTARDQIGVWGDANNWGNPYTYVGNNPYYGGDPSGNQAPAAEAMINRFATGQADPSAMASLSAATLDMTVPLTGAIMAAAQGVSSQDP